MRRFALLFLCLCACSDVGLGVPGSGTPLPAGGLPRNQTLEGGAQIQLSVAGMQKITAGAVSTIAEAIDQDLCVAPLSSAGADACIANQAGCSPGCSFDIDPVQLDVTVTNANLMNVAISATSATASVRIDPPIFSACTLLLTVGSLSVDADVALSIDPATGALRAVVDQINSVDASQITSSGCSVIAGTLPGIIDSVVNALVATWTLEGITPALNAAIDQLMPEQELAAVVDLPALLLTGPAASNGSGVETRLVPGGYVQLVNGGLSLGVITGVNSDDDPATRVPGLYSEPNPCVGNLTAPDFGSPPFSLPINFRGAFSLLPAGPFIGQPMLPGDLLVGVSQTALDLAGHHMVASGGLCLTVDAARAAFVRRDVLDDLLGLPLAAADAELRLVVRPQQALRFEVGTGTEPSPHLSATLPVLEIDLDTVSAGTPTPALRLSADVELGLQLGTRHDDGLPVRLEATRSSLAVTNAAVEVFDARYAGLNAAALDALASTAVDVVWSTLGADAGTVLVSSFGEYRAENVAVTRVTTTSDDFLAVTATLGDAAPVFDPPAPTPQPLSTNLVLPSPAALRTALVAGNEAGLPTLHVALPASDGVRPLEHAWRTAGGAWRPYEATGGLVIRDRSFAWQGERTIELRSRVAGDDGTTSPIGSTNIVIDYAPPTVFADQVSIETHLVVPARDTLTDALEWAMGRVGESEPATGWTSDSNLDLAAARALGSDIVVYARDEAGNVAQATVHVPEPGAAAAAGVACAALVLRGRRAHARRGRPRA